MELITEIDTLMESLYLSTSEKEQGLYQELKEVRRELLILQKSPNRYSLEYKYSLCQEIKEIIEKVKSSLGQ